VKSCSQCGEMKYLSEFHKRARSKDGLCYACKPCVVAARCAYAKREPERHAVQCRKGNSKWRKENRELCSSIALAWEKAFPARVNANQARRNASKLQATPAWANEFFIEEAYELAQLRTKATGFQWHVDHIVPLRSKFVCGLHVESNLQVIPAVENCIKSNKYWPDMPVA
jgi:hypothetical protein